MPDEDHDGRKAIRREKKLLDETRKALESLRDRPRSRVFDALLDSLAEHKLPRLELATALVDSKITCSSPVFVELLSEVERLKSEREVHNSRMADLRHKKAYLKRCALEYDHKFLGK